MPGGRRLASQKLARGLPHRTPHHGAEGAGAVAQFGRDLAHRHAPGGQRNRLGSSSGPCRRTRRPCAGWRRCRAPSRPGFRGAWGRPARLRTGGAGVCRGAGPPPVSQRLRRPVRCGSAHSDGARAAARPVWGRARHRVRWASRAPGRAAGPRLPAPGTAAMRPVRPGWGPGGPGRRGRSAHVVGRNTGCAGRPPPPWSRRAPRPVESTVPSKAARYRCRGPPSGGSRPWSKWPPAPRGGCVASPACRPPVAVPWRAPGGSGRARTGAGSVSPHRTAHGGRASIRR